MDTIILPTGHGRDSFRFDQQHPEHRPEFNRDFGNENHYYQGSRHHGSGFRPTGGGSGSDLTGFGASGAGYRPLTGNGVDSNQFSSSGSNTNRQSRCLDGDDEQSFRQVR